jgi:hypothetical protein
LHFEEITRVFGARKRVAPTAVAWVVVVVVVVVVVYM